MEKVIESPYSRNLCLIARNIFGKNQEIHKKVLCADNKFQENLML